MNEKQILEREFEKLSGSSPSMRSALCLSGGGVRSATFNLGILQGLARHGLLAQFDYLSTVSGGGFIGGWLSAWIHRIGPRQVNGAMLNGVFAVEHELTSNPDAPEIQWLRDNSNYLSPRFGAFSMDTWALAAVYLRNLFINLMVFVPALMAILLVPRLIAIVACSFSEYWASASTLVAILYGGSAVTYIGLSLPVVRDELPKGNGQFKAYGALWVLIAVAGGFRFFPHDLRFVVVACAGIVLGAFWWVNLKSAAVAFSFRCGVPLCASAVLFSLIWWWNSTIRSLAPTESHFGLSPQLWSWSLAGIIGMGGGAALACIGYALATRSVKGVFYWIPAILLAVVAGLLSGLSWNAVASSVFSETSTTETYLVIAPLIMIGSFLLGGTILAGLVSRFTSPMDEEWWSKAGGWFLIVALTWLTLGFCALILPVWFGRLFDTQTDWFSIPGLQRLIAILSAVGGSIATVLSLVGGSSRRSSGTTEGAPGLGFNFDSAMSFLGAFGLISILGYLAWLNSGLPAILTDYKGPLGDFPNLLSFIVLALFVLVFGMIVDLKKFSLHYAWKHRIVAGYVAASAKPDIKETAARNFERVSDAFNVQMKDLENQKPLHVVNLALNQVASKRLSWQERKASSFTVTPYATGNEDPGYTDSAQYTNAKKGISLGTAVAISGAAVSPNMGYMMSSGALRLLMTLFNIRLGVWLPNPGRQGSLTKRFNGLRALWGAVAEALGLTDSSHPFVYLSDGGHFDNLGLYEMVKRRCRFIVVSDASTDPNYDFESFSQSVRKIRIDLNAEITFKELTIRKPNTLRAIGYAAIGQITYDDQSVGALLYIKPTLNDSEPIDVKNYATMEPSFPQESIADQFFSESQFESYRRLGQHIVDVISGGTGPLTLKEFTERV